MSATRLKVKGGAIRDQIKESIYDTITIGASESPIGDRSFFTNVQGKAKYLTNLRQNSQLEGQVSFRIHGLKIESHVINYANRAVLPLVAEHSFLKLRVGEKDYWQGPMREICGQVQLRETTFDANQSYAKLGNEQIHGLTLSGQNAIDIAPLQSFQVDWSVAGMSAAEVTAATPAADTKVSFVCYLQGLKRRPVQ